MRDITLQNIVDWLIPDFKEKDDKFKSILLTEANKRRVEKGKLDPSVLIKKKPEGPTNTEESASQPTHNKNDVEFKLLPFPDED